MVYRSLRSGNTLSQFKFQGAGGSNAFTIYFRSSSTLTTWRTYKKTEGISTSPIIIGRNEGSLNQRNVNTQDTYCRWRESLLERGPPHDTGTKKKPSYSHCNHACQNFTIVACMLLNVVPMIVVYFDQCLGVVHSKHWLEYTFSMYFLQKS